MLMLLTSLFLGTIWGKILTIIGAGAGAGYLATQFWSSQSSNLQVGQQ